MKKLTIIFAVLALVGCSTSNSEKEVTTAIDTAHTAQNSLDWAGIYQGVLPCADCEGIKTTLTLNFDGSFKLEEVYKKGTMKITPETKIGNFSWISGSLIQLNLANQSRVIFVGERFVEIYDRDGKKIESELNYRLKQNTIF